MRKQYATPCLGILCAEEQDVIRTSEVGVVGDDNVSSWNNGWNGQN